MDVSNPGRDDRGTGSSFFLSLGVLRKSKDKLEASICVRQLGGNGMSVEQHRLGDDNFGGKAQNNEALKLDLNLAVDLTQQDEEEWLVVI